MLEQILQSLLIIAAIGLMLLVLYQIVKVSAALFLIGLISGLIFIEIYGSHSLIWSNQIMPFLNN